jgi:FlaA1/EpsC-like NDP-sugar epimerase/lipopolysaccharide/colanic/teichoic acid biosynthesis glycosyltransferase
MAASVLINAGCKRLLDILVAGSMLALGSPLLVLIALWIKLDSRSPVIFRQWRLGRGTKPFQILKFRTMVEGAQNRGLAVTVGDDPRITRVGRILRRYHLDELPNLVNVLIGDMSLVGPRPEVVEYLPHYSAQDRRIFDVRPGLTDLATLQFRREAEILALSDDPERTYLEEILPGKIRLSLKYLRHRNFTYDVGILLRTAASIVWDTEHPGPFAHIGQWLRSHRRPFVLLVHVALFALSFGFSFLLRFDLLVPADMRHLFWTTLPILLLVRLLAFSRYHLYQGLWRYVGMRDVMALTQAVTLSSMVFAVVVMITIGHGFPRSILVMDWLICLALTAGVRMMMRISCELVQSTPSWGRVALIVGASDAGEVLVREVERSNVLDYTLVGFVDDDDAMQGRRIHGIPVLGRVDELTRICARYGVDDVLIAMPSAGPEVQRRVVRQCMKAGVVPKTVPMLKDLLQGRARIGQLQEVQPEDLLGRQAIHLDNDRIRAELENKTVLITGAAGSIGSELCRQIALFRPRKLVLYERAESALYFLASELASSSIEIEIVPVVGDILDRPLLDETFRDHPPDVVYHAAAYKHVPLMEDQPLESIRNNLFGTEEVALAARRAGAKKFVLISTDKAVRPVGVMGMTKNAAERLLQSLGGGGTVFTAVRFGNVLGSNGSVIPLFQRQIAMGGPVTVTDPGATRYFMIVSEAAQLVLQAGVMGVGGDLFFLDMGPPMRIMDMARDLIRLNGLAPESDVPVEVIGLRHGERLNEELVMEQEELGPSEHEKVYRVKCPALDARAFRRELERLRFLVEGRDHVDALRQLKCIVCPGEVRERTVDSPPSYPVSRRYELDAPRMPTRSV